jgi:hypothetical protein
MSLALAALLSVSGLALATSAYLHAASQYLEQGTIKLQRLPALWPIYYRMLLSVLTKPRRLPTHRAMLTSMRIMTGGRQHCVRPCSVPSLFIGTEWHVSCTLTCSMLRAALQSLSAMHPGSSAFQ